MPKTVEDVKQELRNKYIGKSGIHGFGIDESQNAIRIYHTPASAAEQEELFDEMEKAAHPYKIIKIVDEPAKITK